MIKYYTILFNQMDQDNTEYISTIIKYAGESSIVNLNKINIELGLDIFYSIIKSIKKNNKHLALMLQSNKINNDTLNCVFDYISDNKIFDLNLDNNNISDIDMYKICEFISNSTSLISLSLESNDINEMGAFILFICINNMNSTSALVDLSLRNNCINNKGMFELATNFNQNNLTSLNISMNEIGPIGIIALCDVLKDNKKLIILDVSFNYIGNEGLVAIGKMLKTNNTLKKIDVSGNDINNILLEKFASKIINNKTLETLVMNQNSISSIKWMIKLIKYSNINFINLLYNPIEQTDIRKLSNFIKNYNITVEFTKDLTKEFLESSKNYMITDYYNTEETYV